MLDGNFRRSRDVFEFMNTALTSEQLEILRRLDGCTLANAIETFDERLRNEGFTDNTVHCQFPHLKPILGYAATVKVRGSAPPTTDGRYPDRTDWWDYILSLPVPCVVVVQDVATKVGLGSLLGAVRDLPAAEKLGFQLFAGSISVSHAYVHIVEFGTPVEIGGLKIQSGDLVHGDLHGVQTIPSNIAGKVPAAAAEIIACEQELIALCQSKDFSVEKLRDAIAKDRS
jgi:4-hydroxy-4-methyl-2-oxoglutarate aldolase